MDDQRDTAVGGLAEIALRVEDMAAMRAFYEEVIRLPVLDAFDGAVFYDLGPGVAGHTQVFVLFDRTDAAGYAGIDPARTTVDHVAFGIDRADYGAERERLEARGLDVRTATHEWVQWRSLYVTDPEGNSVELVCHDPSI